MSPIRIAGLAQPHFVRQPTGPVGKVWFLPYCLATALSAFVTPDTLRAQSNYATPYTFMTLAGSGVPGSADGTGAAAAFSFPQGVAVDGAGNVYVADTSNDAIRKISPAGVVTTLANLPALPDLFFSYPTGVAVDSAGNVYVSEGINNRIQKISPAGVVTTLAGNSTPNPDLPRLSGLFAGTIPDPSNKGYTDGPASTARFNSPQGVAVDGSGNVFVADFGNRTIRKITPGGSVSTLAGTGWLLGLGAIAVDASGNVYVADYGLSTIRKVTPDGVATTIAGKTYTQGSADGPAGEALFNNPSGVAVDSGGNVFVSDSGNGTIRKISSAGVVTTLAGLTGSWDNVNGTGSVARFGSPRGVAVDAAGNLFVADSSGYSTIRKGTLVIGSAVQTITFADPGNHTAGEAPFRLSATSSSALPVNFTVISGPATLSDSMVTLTGAGTVTIRASQTGNTNYAAAPSVDRSFTVNPAGTGPAITTQPSTQTVASGHSISFQVVATGAASYQWQASTNSGATWTTLASNSTYSGTATNTLTVNNAGAGMDTYLFRVIASGSTGSTTSNAATLAVVTPIFPSPVDVAVSANGSLWVSDNSRNTVQTVSSAGVAMLLAGSSGQQGATDGKGSLASFRQPGGLTFDSSGNLYVADTGNSLVRKIAPDGSVTTFAGSASNQGFRDGIGTGAWFNAPAGLALDSAGNLYVADTGNSVIRMITPGGVVTTLAGTAGVRGSADGAGSAAQFNQPCALTVDASSNLYVADTLNHTIRRITSAGTVSTWAGLAGVVGTADGSANNALFNNPRGVTVDGTGNVYVADSGNSTIRRITPAGGVSTIAGLPGISGLKDGIGGNAWFNQPMGLRLDGTGNLYVADNGNAMIRRVAVDGSVTTWVTTQGTATPAPAPAPAPTSTFIPTSVASGGGGGGGAPSIWFAAMLGLISLLRKIQGGSGRTSTGTIN